MLSRPTVLAVARLATACFEHDTFPGAGVIPQHHVRTNWFADLLFEKDFDDELVTVARSLYLERGTIQSFILQLYKTPLSPNAVTGDAFIKHLASSLLEYAQRPVEETIVRIPKAAVAKLLAALELDGYVFRDGRLLASEGETKDVEEERGELMTLYVKLGLPGEKVVRDCLANSETHYNEGRPRDCIGNARHYLEQVLEDVAVTWSKRPRSKPLTLPDKGSTAGLVRKYLEDAGLLSLKERLAFDHLYGLLSDTGSHPAMAEPDQARIFRRLALSMVLFVLLRYQTLASEAP